MIRVRLLLIALLALAALLPAQASAAQNDYSLVIDGEVVLEGLPAASGVIYAPVVDTYALLGMKTTWDAVSSSATVTGHGMTIVLRQGAYAATVNGKRVDLPGAVTIRGGKLHYPAVVAALLPGIETRYSAASRKVYYHTPLGVYASRLLASGDVRASVRSGQGKLTRSGATVYEGALSDGVPSGTGRLYRDGKLIYEGSFAGGLPSGRGTSVDREGDRYEGLFAAGWPEGEGKLFVNGLMVYEGEWKAGRIEGTGTAYDRSGARIYAGEFVDGMRSGYGVEYDPESGARLYAGEWSADKRHGAGKLFDPANAGKVAFIGRFAYGEKEGAGSEVVVTDAEWFIVQDGVTVGKESRPTVYYTRGQYRAGKLTSAVERITYTGGMLEDGTPHGEGKFYRVDGSRASEQGLLHNNKLLYEGQVRAGERHGQGIAYDDRGFVVYNGEWKNDRRQGYGLAYEQGVLVYAGSWVADRYSGTGTLVEIVRKATVTEPGEARLISGTFTGGKPSDNAVEYVYIGQMRDGIVTGQGKLYLVSQSGQNHGLAETFLPGRKGLKVYEGTFVNGLKEGHGIEYSDGRRIYNGEFSAGEREGYGTLYHSSSGVRLYEGMFKDGRYNGEGTEYNEWGVRIYTGNFVDGVREGRGKSYYGTTLLYEGDFKNGLRHGIGTEYAGAFKVYTGGFALGLRDGWGAEYDTNGRIVREGMYRNGVRVG